MRLSNALLLLTLPVRTYHEQTLACLGLDFVLIFQFDRSADYAQRMASLHRPIYHNIMVNAFAVDSLDFNLLLPQGNLGS